MVHIKRSRLVFTRHSLNSYGSKTIFCIFSMSCSWAGLPRASGFHQVIWIISLILVTKTLWVFFKIKTTLLFTKTSSETKLFRDGANSFYLDQLVSIRVSKFTYVTQTTNISLRTRSPLFLGQGVSVGLSVLSYPKTLSCLFPFFKSLC